MGIDIGGQSIRGIRVGADGIVSCRASLRTPASKGAGEVLAALGSVTSRLEEAGPVSAIGIGTPGAVDLEGRVAAEAVNIPGWKGSDVKGFVEKMTGVPTGVPVSIRNDGNLAAYAEWALRKGASRHLLFVGLGTGIGGGYIDEGRILGGTDDKALEIGHIIVYPGGRPCLCGMHGCVEAYASAPAVVATARELAPSFDSELARRVRAAESAAVSATTEAVSATTDPGRKTVGPRRKKTALRPEDVYAAFSRGDPLAVAVDEITCDALARACATAIALLAPDCVVLGGGLMLGAGHLVGAVARRVHDYVYAGALTTCRFESALCGHEAGLWGAALYGAGQVLSAEKLLRLAASVGEHAS